MVQVGENKVVVSQLVLISQSKSGENEMEKWDIFKKILEEKLQSYEHVGSKPVSNLEVTIMSALAGQKILLRHLLEIMEELEKE